jgi:hypothetical protein
MSVEALHAVHGRSDNQQDVYQPVPFQRPKARRLERLTVFFQSYGISSVVSSIIPV